MRSLPYARLVAPVSRLAAILLMLGYVVTGVGLPSAQAADVSCKGNYRESTVTIGARGEKRDRLIYRYGSGAISYADWRYERRSVPLGGVKVRYGACKKSGSTSWSIVSIRVEQIAKDVDMTVRGGEIRSINPASGPDGYYLNTRRVTGSAITVQATKCWKKPSKINLGMLTSVPVPGPAWIGVGQWIAGLLLPSAPSGSAYCSSLGTKDVAVNLSPSTGAVTIASMPSGIGAVRTTPYVCSLHNTDCWTQWQDNVALVRGALG